MIESELHEMRAEAGTIQHREGLIRDLINAFKYLILAEPVVWTKRSHEIPSNLNDSRILASCKWRWSLLNSENIYTWRGAHPISSNY